MEMGYHYEIIIVITSPKLIELIIKKKFIRANFFKKKLHNVRIKF